MDHASQADLRVDLASDQVVAILQPLLGPHTAGQAVKMVCAKIGRRPSELEPRDAEGIAAQLIPMLRTLLGRAAAERARMKILEKGRET